MVVHRGLQQPEVGGRQHQRTLLCEVLQHAERQGRALVGVGAAADLVAQHQGVGPGLAQELRQVAQVGREAGQGLGDGLVVPQVGQHAAHQGQPRVLAGGHVPAALGQQAEHADGLQGDRLAAGVGSADHQGPGAGRHLQLQGHDGAPAGGQVAAAEGLHQERVPPAGHPQHRARGDCDSLAADGLAPQEVGPGRVHLQHQRRGLGQGGDRLLHRAVQLEEDARLLGRHLQARLGQLVGQRDHARRLDVERGPGLGAVVDDARDPAAVPRAQGQAEAVAAHGHLGGGGPALALGVGHGAVDRVAHGPLLAGRGPAQAGQQRARPVDDAPVRIEAAPDGAAEPAEAGGLGRGLAPAGAARAQFQQVVAQVVQVLGRRGDGHQVGAVQAQGRGSFQQIQQTGDLGQGRPLVDVAQGAQLVGQFVVQGDGGGLGEGSAAAHRRPRRGR